MANWGTSFMSWMSGVGQYSWHNIPYSAAWKRHIRIDVARLFLPQDSNRSLDESILYRGDNCDTSSWSQYHGSACVSCLSYFCIPDFFVFAVAVAINCYVWWSCVSFLNSQLLKESKPRWNFSFLKLVPAMLYCIFLQSLFCVVLLSSYALEFLLSSHVSWAWSFVSVQNKIRGWHLHVHGTLKSIDWFFDG